MKKFFTFLSLCLLSITVSAQEYVFTDKEGNVFEDGTVIRTEPAAGSRRSMPTVS